MCYFWLKFNTNSASSDMFVLFINDISPTLSVWLMGIKIKICGDYLMIHVSQLSRELGWGPRLQQRTEEISREGWDWHNNASWSTVALWLCCCQAHQPPLRTGLLSDWMRFIQQILIFLSYLMITLWPILASFSNTYCGTELCSTWTTISTNICWTKL